MGQGLAEAQLDVFRGLSGGMTVDEADQLKGLDVRPLHRRSVRGYRSLVPYLVR